MTGEWTICLTVLTSHLVLDSAFKTNFAGQTSVKILNTRMVTLPYYNKESDTCINILKESGLDLSRGTHTQQIDFYLF